MNLKNKLYLALVGLLLLVGGIQTYRLQHAQTQSTELALQLSGEKQLNDSTNARLAITTAHKDSLEGSLSAAKALNGRLVAAARIRVPARDTVIVYKDLPTTVADDSTRTAEFSDTTFAGTVTGKVTAPPCCAPLGITYKVHRPEFSPQVGFVQVGNSYVATVTWQGEEAHVEAPFFTPPPKRLPWLGYFVGGYINQDRVVYGRGGVEVRTPLINGQAGLDTRGELFAGLAKSF